MKRRWLIVGSFAFVCFFNQVKAQDTVSKVNKTQIDIVYNHYVQEGNNSAITGGVGTEELTVYGPSLKVKKNWKNKALNLHFGADVISSVSTDNIDFVMSSASILDTRSYFNAVYERHFDKKDVTLYGGGSFSIESDYFSVGSKVGLVKENAEKLSQYSAELQVFNDDLRWGWLDEGVHRPQKLIYPQELRYQEWYDTYRRNSFNLKLGYSRAINKRTILGVYPLLTYQAGLLATPFHRIYFTDDSQAVEYLPKNRFKNSLGIKCNYFAGGRFILKNSINPYVDSWGIVSFSIENETIVKLNAKWMLLPNLRFYSQKGSRYFAAYKEHLVGSEYYTSDYDLSSFQTYNLGLGFKFAPHKKMGKKHHFKSMTLRYSLMHRTNGLNAHILSLHIGLEKEKKSKRNT